MKHRYFYIPLMLLAAASCSIVLEEPAVQDPIEEPAIEQGSFDIVVNARIPDESADAQTKVTISQVDDTHYNMSWSATGETATLVESRRTRWNTKSYNSNSADLSGEGVMAFSFGPIDSFDAQAAGFGYDIFYPQTAFVSSGEYNVNVILNMPDSQTPLAGSPDPSAALLCGRAGVFDEQPTTPLNAEFTHLAAYGKMNLRGIPSEETVTSIEITSEDNDIAGRLTYYTWDAVVNSYSTTTVHTITLDGANLTAAPAGFDVWFACKPFTLASGSTLEVRITTSENVYLAILKAKEDILFEVGKVTSFPVTPNRCEVTFESNGGTVIAPVIVKKGQTVDEPVAPTKAESIASGLYLGAIDPDDDNYATFGGWYTDAGCTVPYNFSTAVTASIKLYAKWIEHTPIDVSGEEVGSFGGTDIAINLSKGIKYINGQTLDPDTHYTFVINDVAQVWTGGFTTLSNVNAVLHIYGKQSERRIFTNNNSNLIIVSAGTMVLERNLLIQYGKAETAKTNALITVNSTGRVIMESNCRIDGSVFKKNLVLISAGGAEFIMNGGSISDNVAESDQSIVAPIGCTWGIFTMTGGTISGNTVTATSLSSNVAGAVLFGSNYSNDSHKFVKTDGEITGNSAVRSASGEVTGYMGQQVIYAGKTKKIDDNIDSSTAVSTASINVSPWIDVTVE